MPFPSFKSLLRLWLEASCPLCQRSTPQSFCKDCLRQLQDCQLTDVQQFWKPPLPLFVWGDYGGSLKRAIATLKYQNQPQLAQPLGQWLGHQWLRSPQAKHRPVVVPIPMHRDKQKKRGFNQAELLAQAFCQSTELPLARRGLTRVRETEAQFGLSASDRERNLASAFQVENTSLRQFKGRSVLLLDDIYTTGATARAAVQALRQQGVQVIGIAAIATSRKADASATTEEP